MVWWSPGQPLIRHSPTGVGSVSVTVTATNATGATSATSQPVIGNGERRDVDDDFDGTDERR